MAWKIIGFFNVSYFTTAKAAADEGVFEQNAEGPFLNSREISTILDYSLALSIMRNATEEEINDVFDRINTYGHRLSDQERRQAGSQNEFSSTVRELACALRGDSSAQILPLQSMPSISIDLPKSNHGYEVRSDEVFWVNQGILRATDLRDSLDEQCLADMIACIIGGRLIARSKDALDDIYTKDSDEADRIDGALEVYGSDKITDEIKFCVSEILKVCATGNNGKLRDIIFERRTNNAFPSVFAILLLSFHELIVGEKKKINNYSSVKSTLNNLSARIVTNQKATTIDERRKNIDTVKGILQKHFVKSADLPEEIYTNHNSVDIEAVIRRSEIELANYELKQGLLKLTPGGDIDPGMIDKVVKTICGIANISNKTSGKIIIGVTDKPADAERVKEIDGITPQKIGRRLVVGVNREAKRLGVPVEKYFSIWKEGIKNSELNDELKASVLGCIDFNSFYGLGLIIISVPSQKNVSHVGEDVYVRVGDSTEVIKTPRQVTAVAQRFAV